ncbi:WecB/TagA/CpsF family glycosyltransferase [Brevundimonas sp. NIBR11]|uniref:WecB/TagA/CpsF family glycosyltransferase n=1 Tax=Brevundimonas sp. NIBR11 TaxID=3015999 RepID=UPI0022F0D199|nr:WecB/TagA/CpsF family glycosyltransferase [Brevundimonas sp. NIBR11]WGM31976.1 N-acetylglucosaminyldiphosphoundecaprenol N-acetyl-beta-D-mannosaminyltransferase [Brevundimonas sp. NIBR11]
MTDSPSLSYRNSLTERRRRARTPFRAARRERERVRLLGQAVDLVRPEEVLHHVEAWVEARRKVIIANHNLNSLALMQKEPRLARFYARADLVEVDSTPLIHFAKLLGLQGKAFHRCTYLDWRDHFWSLVDRKGWRVMYIGGAPDVVERARGRLASEYPGADIRARDGFFVATPGSRDNTVVVNEVKAFDPHILFVGMGMPRQELWILDNLDALPDCAIFSVGAAFDYEAGEQRAAPRWMGRMGVEWLFRLVHDPKRLARRYLIEPWSLSHLIVADLWTALRAKRLGRTA